jgi:signal transduction histidine kinase
VLTVEDDGRGYDTGGTPPGLGLRSIERRAAALGGTVHVESAPGRGTLTIVDVPYAP